ncbi:MAG: ECF transporter S component [Bacilli bacterium]|nr:ECF transporter S component [Bacilli bacterium]MBR0301530.1 ECF transporter S component [Bacilli bacterium]
MTLAKGIILGLLLLIFVFLVAKHYFDLKGHVEKKNRTRFIVRVAVFGGFSAILYCVPFLKFPVPFFPSFLEFHFDEIPAFIGAFAYGPMTGFYVLLVKTFIKLPMTNTLAVGEIADLLYSLAFIMPAALFYQKNRTFKGAIKALIIGLFCQLVVSLAANVYVMFPFYMRMFGLSEAALLKICQLANSAIQDVRWSVGFIAVLPFNVIKDAAIILVTLLVYKSTHTLFDRFQK